MNDAIEFPGRPYGLKFENGQLPFHPLANLFPLLEGQAIEDLKNDIASNGLLEPITVYEGKILDGRNRFLACHAIILDENPHPDENDLLHFQPPYRFVQFNGPDPLAFVIARNLHRRHLDESQRAMIAAKIANMKRGTRTDKGQICSTSRATAANLLNVGRSSLGHAAKVHQRATPALIRAVETGKIAVSVAAKLADCSKSTQAAAVAKPREAPYLAKREHRAARENSLASATKTASQKLGRKLYGVIYADPPWRFEPYSRETGMDRAADNHYPTMTLEALSTLKIPAAENCALFLWATVPMLPDALDLMVQWGFAYRSHFVWVKARPGTGYWNRNCHELLLIGVRGDIPAPAPGEQYASVIEAPVLRHSEKPPAFAEMIEAMFPHLPRLEMFARVPRLGWDVWGNETPEPEITTTP